MWLLGRGDIMTVGELIQRLQKMSQNKQVYALWQDRKIFFPNVDIVEENDYVVLYCEEEFDEH